MAAEDAGSQATSLAGLSPEQQRELLARLLREKAAADRTFPMSAGQQGLWHAFRRDPTSTAFNVFLPTRIRSSIDIQSFRQTIELVAGRHPSLHSTFSDQGGSLTQRVDAKLKPEFSVTDLQDSAGIQDREAWIRSIAAKETQQPFDLERGPLLRVIVFKLADDDWLVLALTHHIVVDFWSLVLILGEIREAYPQELLGQKAVLPKPQTNFAQFVDSQDRMLASSRGQQMADFWRQTCAEAATVLEVPSDFIRPTTFTHRALNQSLTFPAGISQRISRFASQHRATAFSVVQAALQVLLSRYSGLSSFFIGSPFSGRSHRDYEHTVGFFVNMLPLKADLGGQPNFIDLVRRTTSTLADALQNEGYPISQIVRDGQISRDPSRSPLFQVSCTFEKSHIKSEVGRAAFLFPPEHNQPQVWSFGGMRQESFYIPHKTCHYDLEFIFEQTEQHLRGMICYCRDLFDPSSIEWMSRNFSDLLASLLAHSDRPVAEVHWRSESHVVRSWTVRGRGPTAACVSPPASAPQPGTDPRLSGTDPSENRPARGVRLGTDPSRQAVPGTDPRLSGTDPKSSSGAGADYSPGRVVGTDPARDAGVGGKTSKRTVGNLSGTDPDVSGTDPGVSGTNPEGEGRAVRTVPGMMLAAARHNPTGVALKFDGRQISYAGLVSVAQAIASQIGSTKQAADGRDKRSTPLPICMQSGPKAVISFLAAHFAGRSVVPIDLKQPPLGAEELLRDVQSDLCVTDCVSPWLAACPQAESLDITPFLDETLRRDPASHNPSWDQLAAQSDEELAYVVYTSGSTGKPKGVMVSHGAVCNTLAWRMRDVPLEHDDRVLMLLSHQFDAGLGIAWTTLTQAAALVWPDARSQSDPDALIDQILRDSITVLPAVPSLLRVLVAHPRFRDCTSLRYIFTGGEAMPPDLPSQIRQVSQARFWNFYGPTEAAIEATACEVTHHDPRRPVPIGYPIEGVEVLVLDAMHRPVPPTVPGELAIAGAGLARGYWNQPDLTAEKFISHPLQMESNVRVYLTGDHGRILPDGRVEFLGRRDHQVKLRGYRLELGEIESVLESHPMVDRAAVRVVDAGTPKAQLQAFVSTLHAAQQSPVVKSEDSSVSNIDHGGEFLVQLKRFVARQLPAYKVPAFLELIADMPLTSSGKVDRKRLPERDSGASQRPQLLLPQTAMEEYLVSAWRETLEVEQLGVNQNFFDAGGSSLQAAMLTSQLSQDLGIHVPTALVFDLADVSQMATRLVELYEPAMRKRFGDACVDQQIQLAGLGQAGKPGSENPLIAALKTTGDKPPLFMVHPPGGIVACYRELAKQLDETQPLYAIRSRGLHGQEELPASLEAMAADYVVAVRETQPQGPYVLGGWSLGGLVAYEMARQLIGDGQSVSRLLLLDTTIPEGSTDVVPAAEMVNVGREYGIELNLEQLGELSPEEQLPFLWDHAKSLGVLDDDSPAEVVARVLEDLQSLFHHHVDLATRYRLAPVVVDINLFRPSQVPFELQVSPDRGWRHLVQSVHVEFVPGHHHSMVQPPHVQELAKRLVASLPSTPTG